jgi:hypothetical protein
VKKDLNTRKILQITIAISKARNKYESELFIVNGVGFFEKR